MADAPACGICRRPCVVIGSSPELKLSRCPDCGTLWAAHQPAPGAPPVEIGSPGVWDPTLAPAQFIDALELRRHLQAQLIVERFKAFLNGRLVADFGCGNGVFLHKATQAGLQVFGTDLYAAPHFLGAPNQRELMKEPWELPQRKVDVLVMLDVLEHHPDPDQFVARLHDAGIRGVLVKVPLVDGPLARLALILNRCGVRAPLDQLLLKNDPFPHRVYFSSQGLIRLFGTHGYALRQRLRLAEVGGELANRVRSPLLPSWILAAAGGVLGLVARAWSDTAVFFFSLEERTSSSGAAAPGPSYR